MSFSAADLVEFLCRHICPECPRYKDESCDMNADVLATCTIDAIGETPVVWPEDKKIPGKEPGYKCGECGYMGEAREFYSINDTEEDDTTLVESHKCPECGSFNVEEDNG